MRNRKLASLVTLMLLLLYFSLIFSLASCSKQPEQSENAKQEPQSPKMEGQGGNWKVTVGSITNRTARSDRFEVELKLEFIGPNAKTSIPTPVLVDSNGQESKCFEIDKIEGNTGKAEELMTFMSCSDFFSSSPTSATDSCSLRTGDRFSARYSFREPKEYANLKLVFGNVLLIPLKVPIDEMKKNLN